METLQYYNKILIKNVIANNLSLRLADDFPDNIFCFKLKKKEKI